MRLTNLSKHTKTVKETQFSDTDAEKPPQRVDIGLLDTLLCVFDFHLLMQRCDSQYETTGQPDPLTDPSYSTEV